MPKKKSVKKLATKTRIAGFDGLRAISVVFVILSHLHIYSKIGINDIALILFHGQVGVKIFFVLSGFLITSLLLREENSYNKISLKNFYIRRTLRIFPCFMVFIATLSILYALNIIFLKPNALIMSGLYLGNFIEKRNYSMMLGHTWSLAVEEHFYLLWPLLITLIRRKTLLYLSVFIFLICIPFEYILTSDIDVLRLYFPTRWTLPAMSGILVGCVLAIINECNNYESRWMQATKKNYSLLAALFLYCSGIWMPEQFDLISRYIQLLGIALIIQWIILNQDSKITKILNLKPVVFFGKISYGVYIWQGFFLTTGPSGAQTWVQLFPQNVVLTIVVAIASFYIIEKPFLKLKHRYSM